jgi:hypothetical protein
MKEKKKKKGEKNILEAEKKNRKYFISYLPFLFKDFIIFHTVFFFKTIKSFP